MIDEGTRLPYLPTPSYFLGCFNIYDREETLGEELEQFNPNDPLHRQQLILNYCLVRNRTYKHRFLLYKCLREALQDKEYDFQSLFKHDPEEYSSFPNGWDEIENARGFFEDICRLAAVKWKEDLQKALLEDPSTW